MPRIILRHLKTFLEVFRKIQPWKFPEDRFLSTSVSHCFRFERSSSPATKTLKAGKVERNERGSLHWSRQRFSARRETVWATVREYRWKWSSKRRNYFGTSGEAERWRRRGEVVGRARAPDRSGGWAGGLLMTASCLIFCTSCSRYIIRGSDT